MARQKQRIQQLPVPWSENHDAIINSTIHTDIPAALESWGSKRVILVYSKSLDAHTTVIKDLKRTIGDILVGEKSGVGAHSPYPDVIAIARLLSEHDADCLISVGSSSYSDACSIARILASTLPTGFNESDMEALVDQKSGVTKDEDLQPPAQKLILVPTSLSASEWNPWSSATNAEGKKQHFGRQDSAADLILLDPVVAGKSPRKLWLSSGIRAVDHCVETLCNEACHEEAATHMEAALGTLLKGLKEYKEGEYKGAKEELLDGISDCQVGARKAMLGLIQWRIPMGLSHAIGHQLGSVAGVMHGVTSCIMLAPVLRFFKDQQRESQERVLKVFNETLGWEEKDAADAVARFVKFLGLPGKLSEVGVTEQGQIDKVAEKTMSDAFGSVGVKLDNKEEILKVLEMAK